MIRSGNYWIGPDQIWCSRYRARASIGFFERHLWDALPFPWWLSSAPSPLGSLFPRIFMIFAVCQSVPRTAACPSILLIHWRQLAVTSSFGDVCFYFSVLPKKFHKERHNSISEQIRAGNFVRLAAACDCYRSCRWRKSATLKNQLERNNWTFLVLEDESGMKTWICVSFSRKIRVETVRYHRQCKFPRYEYSVAPSHILHSSSRCIIAAGIICGACLSVFINYKHS